MKYLLASGIITTKLEEYILDLFKLYINIYPGDIPGMSIGFNSVLTDTMKSELYSEIGLRVNELITNIQDRFKSGVTIRLDSIEVIDETKVKIRITVNSIKTGEIEFNIK